MNSPFFSLKTLSKQINILTLINSKSRNPMSTSFLQEFLKILQDLNTQYSQTQTPQILIINSLGTVFSSGHDLKQMLEILTKRQQDKTQHFDGFNLSANLCKSLQSSKIVSISEIDGFVTAAGAQLALSCDLTVASKSSSFCCPGVKIGLGCTTPGVPFYKKSYKQEVFESLSTGDIIDVEKAYKLGFVNIIAEGEKDEVNGIFKETENLAKKIASFSAEAIAFGKSSFYCHGEQLELEKCYEKAVENMNLNLETENCYEGISAFLEKRAPKWK